MFRDKQIVELLETICKELRQVKSTLKCNMLKESCKKNTKEGEKDNG